MNSLPNIEPQPDTTTCGPTCLHALYRHFGDDVDLHQVIDNIHRLDHGGTLDVFLANHALARGYRAEIYTYNLQVFDPSWFSGKSRLADKLAAQMEAKPGDEQLGIATRGYLEYLQLGGRIRFTDLTRTLIRRLLRSGNPVLTGLSATYLYRSMREWGPDDEDDDVRGLPVGHFVLLTGYHRESREVEIADPRFSGLRGARVYNLCASYRYQATGYYVSLLAAARGHRPLPVGSGQSPRLGPRQRRAGASACRGAGRAPARRPVHPAADRSQPFRRPSTSLLGIHARPAVGGKTRAGRALLATALGLFRRIPGIPVRVELLGEEVEDIADRRCRNPVHLGVSAALA